MINELLLLSKNDVPFIEGHAIIHNPTMNEIALIGERAFNIGTQFLNFSKELLSSKDKNDLEDKSDFDIFMSVMNSHERYEYRTDAMLVLALLFPNCQLKIDKDKLVLKDQNGEIFMEINNDNFTSFRDKISDLFCLKKVTTTAAVYDPADKQARKIAEKLKKRHETLDKKKNRGENENQKVSIFVRYISILSVGNHKDINELMNYTVYQLLDEFTRFQKKQSFDAYVQAKIAGAKDLEEVENWMEDIHS